MKGKVLITGGAGSIGSELCKQIYKLNPKKIIVLDNSELALYKISKLFKKHTNISFRLGSILETNFIKKIIYKNKINLIFHTAAKNSTNQKTNKR